MSISEIVAFAAIAWLGLTLVQGAVRCLKPQLVDADGQILGLVIGAAGFAVLTLLLGLDVRPPSIALAFAIGLVAGYLVSLLAGFEDVEGFAVMRGTGWALIVWGASAAGAVAGALGESSTLLAISILGAAAALGAAAGQTVASCLAVMRIERSTDLGDVTESE